MKSKYCWPHLAARHLLGWICVDTKGENILSRKVILRNVAAMLSSTKVKDVQKLGQVQGRRARPNWSSEKPVLFKDPYITTVTRNHPLYIDQKEVSSEMLRKQFGLWRSVVRPMWQNYRSSSIIARSVEPVVPGTWLVLRWSSVSGKILDLRWVPYCGRGCGHSLSLEGTWFYWGNSKSNLLIQKRLVLYYTRVKLFCSGQWWHSCVLTDIRL